MVRFHIKNNNKISVYILRTLRHHQEITCASIVKNKYTAPTITYRSIYLVPFDLLSIFVLETTLLFSFLTRKRFYNPISPSPLILLILTKPNKSPHYCLKTPVDDLENRNISSTNNHCSILWNVTIPNTIFSTISLITF